MRDGAKHSASSEEATAAYCPAAAGWEADRADRRDWALGHETIVTWLKQLSPTRRTPARVDLREYCGAVDDQQGLPTAAAHSCAGLLQYSERRATGRIIQPSRLFIYQAARKLADVPQNVSASLRVTWKAIRRFGVPPERFWPYRADAVSDAPDPYAFAFQEDYRALAYFRLDRPSANDTLAALRSFVAAGFSCTFGFIVYDSITPQADIPFPTLFNAPRGGQAVLAVGYDDQRRIRSEKGALLVRNSWGPQWGDEGYGWLPYSYVREALAYDFWTAVTPQWLLSGEFSCPRFVCP